MRTFQPVVFSLAALGALVSACGSAHNKKNSRDGMEIDGPSTSSDTRGANSGSGGSDSGSGGNGGNSGNGGSSGNGAETGVGGSGATVDQPDDDNDGLDETPGAAGADDGSGGGENAGDTEGTGSGTGLTGGLAGAGGDSGNGYSYDCGAFSADPGWAVRDGYHAVIVADASDGLNQPVAAAFAEADFGGRLYVVNQGDNVLLGVEVATGAVEVVVDTVSWDLSPRLLTTIVWDERGVFDGNLYVGDQGSNADNNSRIYRVTASGEATTFVEGGHGLDDVYGLAFPPPESAYATGLYVTGDTDNGARVDWGRIEVDGNIHEFSEVAGAEGIAFDTTGLYDDALWASRPNGGGYSGDNSITPLDPAGVAGAPIASGLAGIHAVTFSSGGDLGASMYAASWSTGQLFQIDPQGKVNELASGLSLTNYDGNILAVSSDGNVMFVADRLANQLVCIEAI